MVFRKERKVISQLHDFGHGSCKVDKERVPCILAYVRELEKGKMELASIPIVREYSNVFLKEFLGLPLVRKI